MHMCIHVQTCVSAYASLEGAPELAVTCMSEQPAVFEHKRDCFGRCLGRCPMWQDKFEMIWCGMFAENSRHCLLLC